ncbi:MAG: hypothetical protein GEV28_11005 [Actinophytocola sp.]|uniref:hypothetical protein n=1 Tax=Actinophytocola sp. TaxID=1872138 RepID=UPI0013233C5B|nr:hypothetical protein [Actinophytocola sp.]MPZ80888.1 hypothetical protein [Actinophytocola sp.]
MTALVFSPGRLRAWMHVRGVAPAALADSAEVTTAYVQACAYGHPVAAPPTHVVLAAWAARLGCEPADLRSATPHDPNEYWRAANKAMPRMSKDDLAAVAGIFKRTARRTARRQR